MAKHMAFLFRVQINRKPGSLLITGPSISADSRSSNALVYMFWSTILLVESTTKFTNHNGEVVDNNSQLQRTNKAIDVWWLSDDGGLTLLIPYLLTLPKSHLEGARLRIFTVVSTDQNMETEKVRMAALLKKFRIRYNELHVVSEATEVVNSDTKSIEFFDSYYGGILTKDELARMKRKTDRHFRSGDLLKKYSSAAKLVVVTLPFPHTGISSGLYTLWLEMITRDLPSTLLIRGNHQSVLTFYS
uniref:SLC12 domain-containing protein n=1 Tax=Heterorhabditis bacteriophora TaxID=37862 RepID=A0A1I7XTI5_HETBA